MTYCPTKEAAAREGVEQAIRRSLAELESVLRALAERPPASIQEMVGGEEQLRRDVSTRCLDPVFGALLRLSVCQEAVLRQAAEIVESYPRMTLQVSAQKVDLTLFGGTVATVETSYFLERSDADARRKRGERGRQGSGVYPCLAVLGIHHRLTPALASEVGRLVGEGTYEHASQALARRGVRMDAEKVGDIAGKLAARGLRFREYLVERAETDTLEGSHQCRGKRIVIGTDGGRTRYRLNRVRGKKGWLLFEGVWKEPRVIVIYEVDDNGRRVKGGLLRYDATRQKADEVFRLILAYLVQIGADEAAEWVFVADGAMWIWERIPWLVEKAGYQMERVTQVVDFYHAMEHIHKFAALVPNWTDSQRKYWAIKMTRLLSKGEMDMESFLAEARLQGQGIPTEELESALDYFVKRQHLMDYGRLRQRRIPIGSGAVESAVRRIVNLRLKGNGIFWTDEMGEAVLHLRAQLLCGQWERFVAAVLQDECFWLDQSEPPTRLPAVA